MINKELTDVIDALSKKLEAQYPDLTQRESQLAQAVKLTEEVGELCAAIIAGYDWQRPEKSRADLEGEVADVILVTLVLAKRFNVDINSALEKKLSKIKERLNY